MKLSMTLLLAAGAGSALAAGVQAADPRAAAPAVVYRSVFETYVPLDEARIADWREVNAEMERLGGHRGHVGAEAPVAQGAPEASTGDASHRHHH